MRKFLIVSCFVLASCAAKKTTPVADSAATQPKKSEVKEAPAGSENKEPTLARAICSKGRDSRTIEVLKSGSGCRVVYTKFGAAKEMAVAKNGAQYCTEVKDKIQTHLTGVGFHCE